MNFIDELLKDEKVEWKKLGEVCEFKNGFAFKSNLFSKKGTPIIRITNISNGKIIFDNLKYFKLENYEIDLSSYKVFPNDILIAMSGATTGKIGYNYTSNIGYLNQRVGKFISNSKFLNNRFLLLKFYIYLYLVYIIILKINCTFNPISKIISTVCFSC